MSDGQLDECDLTLQELTTIREAMISALTAIYHARIDYPGFNPPLMTGPLQPLPHPATRQRGARHHLRENLRSTNQRSRRSRRRSHHSQDRGTLTSKLVVKFLVGGGELFGEDARLPNARHEVCVACPPRHYVRVDMIGDARTGSTTEIHADVIPLRAVGLSQRSL